MQLDMCTHAGPSMSIFSFRFFRFPWEAVGPTACSVCATSSRSNLLRYPAWFGCDAMCALLDWRCAGWKEWRGSVIVIYDSGVQISFLMIGLTGLLGGGAVCD